ncbi:ROK family protein [Ferrimonas senticii]|uniref:ROK family protein n=1 Tax=Ferrimonas senticii TaxID=394566 RepID=UPI0004088FC8|nr:ROK family protein [Ferrimonas senticii]
MRVGIDLGGTKIEAIVIDNQGVQLWRQRLPTPKGDYQGTVATMATLIALAGEHCSALGTTIRGVGVGIPGVLSKQTGYVKNANSQCLNGQNLAGDLSAACGLPVRLANDANCFALSEATDGAGKGHQVVFAAIIGTGCGAGIVVNGGDLVGANGLAGEWGHNPMPWLEASEFPGPECFCGRHGCIEQYVSGSGYQRLYQQLTGETVTAQQIEQRAEQGEVAALRARQQLSHYLGNALAHVVNLLDPDVIVLGGGLSNLDWLYPQLNNELASRVVGQECITQIVKNHHGDSSGVRGAAWLWEAQC